MINNTRPPMLGMNGLAFPPSAAPGGNLGNINGVGAMGGMGNMGGMNGLGNMGGMGGMGGMPATSGAGSAAGQLQQQHPGSHASSMGLLPNHQPQPHTNQPPMGGLQPGGNQPGQNQGVSGVPQPSLGQQPNGMVFMNHRDQMLRQNFERQRLQAQQAAQHSQAPQQQQGGGPGGQQMPHQQGPQQGPQPGGVFPAGMSLMGNYGSPRPRYLVNAGSANGMGSMAGIGGMGGTGGGIGGVGGAGNFQGLPPGASAAGTMAQLGGMRRVPSQTGQPNQPQPPVGAGANTGMNMSMLGAMSVGGVGGMGNVGLGMPTSLNALRQGAVSGGMPGGPQRLSSFPGAAQPPGAGPGGPGPNGPGQLAPGHQRSVSSMAQLPPEVAAVISQQDQRHREQQQQQQAQVQAQLQHQQQSQGQQQGQGQGPQQHLGQQQHSGLPIQHPRTPSAVNVNVNQNAPMPPHSIGMNGMNNHGAGPSVSNAGGPGQIPNPMNPNVPNPMGAPNMQRAPSAQSMAPSAGGIHPGLPNHPNPNPQQIIHGQQQQTSNPPPFTNPLHHGMQNPQIQQHPQQRHPQLGGGPQQHLGGQQGPQGPSGLTNMGGNMGMPMSGMPSTGGGMQGHPGPGAGPGQQHPMNAGSPPRPGTGGPGPGQSQPQTPSIPVSMRPQSRLAPSVGVGEQQQGVAPGMMGFPAGGGQPQFGGGQMRMPGPPGGPGHQQHPGQQGPLGHPFGAQAVSMAGRGTPHPHQTHPQSPMAGLGGSPGAAGPMNGRPGSSSGPPVPGGLSTPNLAGMVGAGGIGGGRVGHVGQAGGGPGAGGGFPTPAQQLAEQHAARNLGMGPFAGSMVQLTSQAHMPTPGGPGSGAPGQGQGPHGAPQRPPTSQAHPTGPGHGPQQSPFASPVVRQTSTQQQQRANAGSPAHRQPTPALQQAGTGQGPLGRMGTPTLAQGLTQAGAVNRSPSRARTPSRQMPQTPALGQGQPQGPSQTPRTQAAQLPMTPSAAGPSSGPNPPGSAAGPGRASHMGMLGRQGIGLGIAPMQGPPGVGGQQSNAAGGPPQPQQQQAPSTAGAQRPTTQDGSNPPPNVGMVPLGGFMQQRPAMFPNSQGIARLLAFSESLSHPKLPFTKDFWESLVAEHFSSKAVVKITLWKDNAQQEAKPFDITMPILPRFFLVTSQAGVSSMSINYDGAKERSAPVPTSPYATFVDCPNASWTFVYANGYIVTLRGSFTATLVPVPTTTPPPSTPAGTNSAPPPPPYLPFTMKIETITFNAEKHEKALRVEAIQGRRTPKMMSMKTEAAGTSSSPGTTIGSNSAESTPVMEEGHVGTGAGGEMVIHLEKATIPTEPVNAFGIPQATMRCLELAESVGQMSELIEFTLQTGYRPLDALNKYASILRESGFIYQNSNQNSPGHLMDAHQTNGVVTSPAVTLYQSSPPVEHATTNTGGLQPPPSNLRAGGNVPGSGQGQPGQRDTTSSPNMASTPASAQTPNAPPLSAAPTSTSSTPMVSHATLKRKAGDTASPTTATAEHAQPPTKRTQRKRSVRH